MKYILFLLLILIPAFGYAEDIESCEPKVLYYGDTLTVNLNTPHGADFIINHPSGKKWFEICFWYPKSSNRKPDTMFEYSECKDVKQVKIIAGITEIGGWDDNDSSFGPFKSILFQDIGIYKVIVSPNLETENPVVSSCEIEYKGKR